MTRVVSGNTTSVCLSTYQLSDDQIQFYYLQLIHATGTKIVVHSSNSTHTILTSTLTGIKFDPSNIFIKSFFL
jgi:hypothetical protein